MTYENYHSINNIRSSLIVFLYLLKEGIKRAILTLEVITR